MAEWMPIETAPKDGTVVLLYRPNARKWGMVAAGRWDAQEFGRRPQPYWQFWPPMGSITEAREWPPTHWMPLPEQPDGWMAAPRVEHERDDDVERNDD